MILLLSEMIAFCEINENNNKSKTNTNYESMRMIEIDGEERDREI